jgi:predicted dehydrogenase
MVKVGLCGAGFMGRMHPACYAGLPGVKVVAVADVRRDFAEAAAKPCGARIFSTAAELIAKADVDMVDICLPTYLHARHVIQAAQRGLDCFCEKPMALNAAEGRRMLKAVRAAKIKFTVGHVIRFWPEYQLLKDMIDRRRFGKLRALLLRRFGTRPEGWKKWFQDPRLSNGAALDLHIHDADFVQYLFGRPNSLDSVGVCRKGSWDQISTQYHYPDVAVTAVGGWWPVPEAFDMAFRAVFDKAIITYSSRLTPMTLSVPGKEPEQLAMPQATGGGKVDAGGNISSRGGYFNEIQYWVDCLLKGREPQIVTGEDGLAAVELIEREMASAAKKLGR